MISKNTIAEIFDKMAIEDIVGDFVSLRNRGVNKLGLCPFHNEKTPSFTVSPAKNIFKCFGCGRGGNGIDFLMEHEAMSYPEALRYVAKMYNIDVEEDVNKTEDRTETLYRESLQIVNNFALDHYKDALHNSDLGRSVGLGYLKQRGFSDKTIATFELGFAARSPRDGFTQKAIKAGYNEDTLRALGLTNKHGSDFFFDRIMFPIHSLSGLVLAFAGRILKKNDNAPKYLNSPETEIYHKRKVLFGMHLAKKEIRNKNLCFLVEGYTDVMMMHQHGVENVVATSGTALTPDQIRIIKRYTQNICLIFDADQAGVKASVRGIDLILEAGMNVQILTLPEGEDPDSFVQSKGQQGFGEFFESEVKDFLLYKAELGKVTSADDPVQQAQTIQELVESISKIQDSIKRHLYIKETAALMSIPESALMEELDKKLEKNHQRSRAAEFRNSQKEKENPNPNTEVRTQKAKNKSVDLRLEENIIRILVQHGDKPIDDEQNVTEFVIENLEDVIDFFEDETLKSILEIYQDFNEKSKVPDLQYLTHETSTEIRKTVIDLQEGQFDSHYSENWVKMWDMDLQTQPAPQNNQKRDVQEAIMRFKLNKATKLCEINKLEIKKYEEEDNMLEYLKHLQIQQKLIEMRNIFAKEFQTTVLR